MNIKGQKVVVVGTGVSGMGAVKLLSDTGAEIYLYDGNDKLTVEDVRNKLPEGAKAEIIIGSMPDELIQKAELLVISPGVPIDSEIVNRYRDAGVPVWGEIELAYNYEKGTVYAITGTNGKTTTTSLLGEIMKNYNDRTFVVGNIGNSYTGEVLKTGSDSITVAEISSFQLETIHDFKPVGTAILNITPDHLNRHYTMENYIKVKESITKNQDENGFCVLNYDDEVLKEFGKTLINPVYFSRKAIPPKGAFLESGRIKYTDGNGVQDLMGVEEMKLFGNHNYENVMAAVCMAVNAGVPMDIIVSTVKNFKGVEHRIEYVREKDGVVYYNDSKGTNPDSSIKAIEAMSRPTILIAGGYNKHSEFDGLLEAFNGKIKLLVLMGETAGQIEQTARKHGFDNIINVKDLKEAVEVCAANAVDGDAVLLSPACASWDMFRSYEQRGELFKKYVQEL
ncbi:MAG: UDP-N-acetylmuramoyl-L-alanine--D-glutamate ligase [Butyrivibrio sp.]